MLMLGGINTCMDFGLLVYMRNVAKSGWFTVFVKNVYILEKHGQHAKANNPHQKHHRINIDLYKMYLGKGMNVNSGTMDTYLHSPSAWDAAGKTCK